MHKLSWFTAVFCFIASTYTAIAQQASTATNPNNIGSVKGVLKDTVHNYTVKSATVSIYKGDSTLLNYQLSNNYGEFSFKNLPINVKLYLEVSHIGYQVLRKDLPFSPTATALDLKELILNVREISLKEVAVGIPPIVMNGDTLEFNAAAFKLDSNAVVEDLLRKIPNITLWGDGQITVNGREVKSLLVNGKEFFGGDFKMATQNISKTAIEKVQVYNTQKNEQNPLDSSLTMNLKLKKSKDSGYFGKVGGGYGTNERFEADGNINTYTAKMQMGLIGAGNNINKISNNVRALTSTSTFKGPGISVEYQPDFRATGVNRTNMGGVTFSYNFIEKPVGNNRNVLTANYFIQNRDNNIIGSSFTTTSIGTDKKVFDEVASKNSTLSTNQNFDSNYSLSKQNHRLTISQNFSITNSESSNQSSRSASNQLNVPTSTNNISGQAKNNSNNLTFSADYGYNNYINYKQKIRSFNIRYSLTAGESDNERLDLTAYRSFIDATSNRDFNRKYTGGGNTFNQQLHADIPGLKRLFFGASKFANIDFSIGNDLALNNTKNNRQVGDFNNTIGSYTNNAYLSNNIRTNTVNETPYISFSKGIYKSLSNRYNKSLSLNAIAKYRFSYQDNRSDKSFQDIGRSYSSFVPAASVSYYVNQYGEFTNNLSANFSTDISLPTIDQLAPLTDSTNLYRIQRGNINLKESKNRELSLYFNHTDQHGKNTLNYNISASATLTDNAFADSSFIDNQNRRTLYVTNIDGYRSANLNASVRKALKLKTSALQFTLSGGGSISRSPGYINNAFNFSNNLNYNGSFGLNYTYKDKIAIEAQQNANFYRSRQNAFNTSYSGRNLATTFSGGYNVTKKFTLNSNISLNSSQSASNKAIDYNIWNASAIYRFLKGNNAELKISALDLLRQNSSILNSGNANSFTFATRSVLQQYFMTTFSYYPRQFGKAPVKK